MRWLLLFALAGCTRALDTPTDQVDCAMFRDKASCLSAGCEVGPTCGCPGDDFLSCVPKGAFVDPPSCPGGCATPATPTDCASLDETACGERSDCYALLTLDEPCNNSQCPSHFSTCVSGTPDCVGPCGPDDGSNGSCVGETTYVFGSDGTVAGCVAIASCQSGWTNTSSCHN